ncbi:site-2 protease family protein [Haloterrigena sp. SYSU A558-1]|uniref:Site-2 protease family protein n=1 Tax=Haloterrigena gelatinilytica TaxID=2741724 RepID=A0A8J8KDN8_9EURY|nr:site-2 protease family protein [Haloterrigena gelatinilytica]NUB89786.1 site-2 protease family protein [Haloterrigena gelatinilytica]NUC74383.1 site-2 protease family protein [Haloterrigena gelatinilytica]
MDDADVPRVGPSIDDDPSLGDGPPLERIESVFRVYEMRAEDDQLVYYGDPRTHPERAMEELWPVFREAGYDPQLTIRHGEYVLVAEPISIGIDGIPWTNILLLCATICSTLFVGAFWWYPGIDPFGSPIEILGAWPFSAAVLTVLGVHELGHYVMSRYHQVDASLPYFIPIPTIIGTMGAVIKLKGRMPNRKALFDIGIAGPLAGLVATVAIAVVGLHLPPVTIPEPVVQQAEEGGFRLGIPPMLELIAAAIDQPLYGDDPTRNVNPVVIGAWVGMFVTFLNLIPVGQLDGGHILRAMIGDLHETVSALVPGALFALAGYLYYIGGYGLQTVFIWILWGFLATLLASAGGAQPVTDGRLGTWRQLLGVVTFGLGLLCFMPVPLEVIQ